jgi:cbb3-type cytochrome oxidase subunit 3
MLQELVARTGASAWAIASMLFFLAAWVAVIVWLLRQRRDELDALARLPLESVDAERGRRQRGTGAPGS